MRKLLREDGGRRVEDGGGERRVDKKGQLCAQTRERGNALSDKFLTPSQHCSTHIEYFLTLRRVVSGSWNLPWQQRLSLEGKAVVAVAAMWSQHNHSTLITPAKRVRVKCKAELMFSSAKPRSVRRHFPLTRERSSGAGLSFHSHCLYDVPFQMNMKNPGVIYNKVDVASLLRTSIANPICFSLNCCAWGRVHFCWESHPNRRMDSFPMLANCQMRIIIFMDDIVFPAALRIQRQVK
jgi:hypothetical protein